MAIFSFVKQAGQLLAHGIEKAADAAAEAADKTSTAVSEAAIHAKIKTSSISPRDLALKRVDDETIKIYAVVESVEEREELILLVGNTPGVARVEDAIKVRPPGGQEIVAAEAPRFYTVRAGDTLASIAASQLGDPARYMDIFNANRNTLSHPDMIGVGQTLRIPSA